MGRIYRIFYLESVFVCEYEYAFGESRLNPGIIPSDDPSEALSVSSKDIHLSKHAKISGIHCTL